MRLLSVLYHLLRQVANMAWFNNNRWYPVLQWLWQKLAAVYDMCWIASVFRPLVRRVSPALLGRKRHGKRQDEPEQCKDDYSSGDEVSSSGESNDGHGREKGQAEPKEEESVDEFNGPEYRVNTADELYCDYDSTWETESNQEGTSENSVKRPAASRNQYKFSRFESAARDMQNYRHDYPCQIRQRHWRPDSVGSVDDEPNLRFYLGKKPSVPDGVYIHDFHKWFGKYDKLEDVHTYIQWLFPLQEPGMNYEATPLTKEEIKAFRESKIAKDNLLKSYELMLDFYGIQLDDETTGKVSRAPNWSERFCNLNARTHNNLRITRILKCLGTLGYVDYQEPLVRFFLKETLIHGELPNVKDSVLSYFVFAVLDKKQRRKLIKFAYLHYDCPEEFVWCPTKIQMVWRSKLEVSAAQTSEENGVSESRSDDFKVGVGPSQGGSYQFEGSHSE